MYEDVLKKELNRLLGDYVPNKVDMDNLSSYLYKIVVSIFKDADMKKEYKSIKSITQLDEDGFKKAVRDIALFTSQRVMLETLNKTYKEIKNIVPVVKLDKSKGNLENDTKTVKESKEIKGEAEFHIDLSAVPKVKKQTRKKSDVKTSNQTKLVAPEFETTQVIDLEKANKGISNLNLNNNDSDDSGDGEDFTLGAGILGGGNYSAVPEIDISLDY